MQNKDSSLASLAPTNAEYKGNMKASQKNKVVVVLGQTASGKSDLAVEIARLFNGEVISADSRQIYKGMDLGSGKITTKEMLGIKHHLLSIISPKKIFNASDYGILAKRAIKNICRKNKLPILCGGSGFYIDTALYDLKLPEVKPNILLRKKLAKLTSEELFKILKKLDPQRAGTIDARNKVRLVRAIEIAKKIGASPLPSEALQKESPYDILKIGIIWPAKKLEERIKLRLEKRLKKGMVAEVRGLIKKGVSLKRLEDFGLEYRYISRFISGKIKREEMKEEIIKESLKYAKRQNTWFKRDAKIKWIKAGDKKALALVKKFIS